MNRGGRRVLLLGVSLGLNVLLCYLIFSKPAPAPPTVVEIPPTHSAVSNYVKNTSEKENLVPNNKAGDTSPDDTPSDVQIAEGRILLPVAVLAKETRILGDNCELTNNATAALNLTGAQRQRVNAIIASVMGDAIREESKSCTVTTDSNGDQYLEIPASPTLLSSSRSRLKQELKEIVGEDACGYTATLLTADNWFQSLNVKRTLTIHYGEDEDPAWEIKTFWPNSEPSEEGVQFATESFHTRRYGAQVQSLQKNH